MRHSRSVASRTLPEEELQAVSHFLESALPEFIGVKEESEAAQEEEEFVPNYDTIEEPEAAHRHGKGYGKGGGGDRQGEWLNQLPEFIGEKEESEATQEEEEFFVPTFDPVEETEAAPFVAASDQASESVFRASVAAAIDAAVDADGLIQLMPDSEVDEDLSFMKDMFPEFRDAVQFFEGCRELGPIGVVAFVVVACLSWISKP